MNRVAVIDIGTNSIKFFVGESVSDEAIRTIEDTNDIARLGEGLDKTGLIGQEAMERNTEAVARFVARARELGAERIEAVGTMALRKAGNTEEFIAGVKEACGIEVRVLPGEEEARLSYLAVLPGISRLDEDLVVFDSGGGSTEFIYGKGTTPVKRFSVSLGAVRITEDYFTSDPVTREQVAAAIAAIDREFREAGVEGRPVRLIGMGGTVTTMGAVKHQLTVYDPLVIQGSELTQEDIEAQIEEYSSRTIEERKKIPGLQPKRADVILAGACILKVITERLGIRSLTISDRGIRHGLAFDLLGKEQD